jgi:hypothetical protein
LGYENEAEGIRFLGIEYWIEEINFWKEWHK